MKIGKFDITLGNIQGYIQGNFRKVLEDMDFLPNHIKEQAEWRLEQVKEKSIDCYLNDECIHCHCQVSAKVFEDRKCEHGCYPEMMSKSEWQEFKLFDK